MNVKLMKQIRWAEREKSQSLLLACRRKVNEIESAKELWDSRASGALGRAQGSETLIRGGISMAALSGDRKLALERLQTESKMDVSAELLTARAAYFEALDTGEDVLNKKFTYAWCLIHLKTRDDVLTGISLLRELSEHKAVQREALFYMANAQYKIEHYDEARVALKQLLALDPTNRPALDLKAQIEHVLKKEGAIGLAVLSAAGAVAVAVGAALLKSRAR